MFSANITNNTNYCTVLRFKLKNKNSNITLVQYSAGLFEYTGISSIITARAVARLAVVSGQKGLGAIEYIFKNKKCRKTLEKF